MFDSKLIGDPWKFNFKMEKENVMKMKQSEYNFRADDAN